ncbi:hypothetical protein [Thiohalocapsa sp. ML1]|jgi:hypothetical protein|uniref:hypothetical protein n=1 Tax=Thiohalocapsa sp. ML1 TaxID=1431688 RepID=UPI000732225D|nr:hypothetical protein [Thiohalocapsa sp. ML1]
MIITNYRPGHKPLLIIVVIAMTLWSLQPRATEDAATTDLFSQPFEQPTILRAFGQGDSSLDEVEAVVLASAPVHYQGKEPSSSGQRTTKKIYAFRLAIELESMMQQEWPKIIFPDVPAVLRDIVATDVGSMARVRMASDNDVAVVMMSKDLADWGEVASKLATSFSDGDTPEATRQLMATAEFGQAVGAQAQRDAALLRDALYAGAVEDVRKIYDGLRRYVLGSTSTQ